MLETTRMKRRTVQTICIALAMLALVLPVPRLALASPAQALLDPLTIPKFENQLVGPPPIYEPTVVMSNGKAVQYNYTVTMSSFTEQILPPSMNLLTPVWGYGGIAKDAVTGASLGYVQSAPGPTFETVRGIPAQVKWVNNITTPYMFPVDTTIHTTGQVYPVPLVVHLHGSETQSYYDGTPNQWFTANGLHGPDYYTYEKTDPNAAVYYYPNAQPPTTLWYHDHALGATRIDVQSGLAGLYLLRDPNSTIDSVASLLPAGMYEMPLIIQDRTFYTNGSLWFPTAGDNPNVHPYWFDGYLGNTIMVNGKVWPNMNVDRGQYRFRILDASDTRVYSLSFLDVQTNTTLPFTQIGSDGGYLRAPAPLSALLIGPAERFDILVDFSSLAPGTKILLRNSALTGGATEPQTVGQIMQLTVTAKDGFKPESLPALLNPTLAGPTFPNLPSATKQRILTTFRLNGPSGALQYLLNGQMWDSEISELPVIGTTENWTMVDLSDQPHTIHLHLVEFQIVSRQKVNATKYDTDWIALQRKALGNYSAAPPWPMNFIPKELPVEPYLLGAPTPVPSNEQGWKDTVLTLPYTVTVIRVRFASQDGSPYPADETQGPGYVWHCHMLDHEDNEMMRPYKVVSSASPEVPTVFIYTLSVILVICLIVAAGLVFLRRKRLRGKKTNAGVKVGNG
jgi:spore coat protein A